MENKHGEPRADVTERMRKELRKIKVIDNREEVFGAGSKEYNTHYVNNEERKSRYTNWRNNMENKGYYRSNSKPGLEER